MQTITFIVVIVLVILVVNSIIKGTNLNGIPPTEYTPPVAISPGATILEMLESLDMTQAELAEWMRCPSNVVNEIIQGEREITIETAIALERVIGRPANFWLNLEENYTRRQYTSVQEMVDAISDPEFAEEFRRYQRRPLVRLQRWFDWCKYWVIRHTAGSTTGEGSI